MKFLKFLVSFLSLSWFLRSQKIQVCFEKISTETNRILMRLWKEDQNAHLVLNFFDIATLDSRKSKVLFFHSGLNRESLTFREYPNEKKMIFSLCYIPVRPKLPKKVISFLVTLDNQFELSQQLQLSVFQSRYSSISSSLN